MRTIKQQHRAVNSPIADLVTYRALPTHSVEHLDPFLFLNHHGPQVYQPNNQGLPFGPHPHRGFETVTFILEGDIMHQDTGGHQSIIEAGGIQWMTAGSGLIHAEVSSPAFKRSGGPLEILQLWVNLPAQHKMTTPAYTGLQQMEIPTVALDEGRVQLHAVSGEWAGTAGGYQPLTDIHLATINLQAGAKLDLPIPAEHTVFFYTIRGKLRVNGQETEARYLTEFDFDGTALHIEALTDAVLLLGHALPFQEPIVAAGPFVMNTEQEIRQAYQDYQAGKFGRWQ
ncbi:pirin family protein [Hymenobacter sp. BT186]|uniref:Pirin family protein n=1 Tax=Hymenobacter telluris TaxID=2816474 RepID=A0A939JEC7_9BACT|nr:pirin family protein [Hymenobacter telluris]MBO0360310.1 pirin family protein [Hymenobacter telluris]MBW3376337.1 pirin family protein [Hymenobacter norwichensis]